MKVKALGVVLLVISIIVGVYGGLHPELTGSQKKMVYSYDFSTDPKFISELPETFHVETDSIIIVLGSCDSCSLQGLASMKNILSGKPNKIYAITDNKTVASGEIMLVEKSITTSLNSVFTPRFYFVSGPKVIASKPDESFSDFLLRAGL
ncbi:MAG: hypothetical protein ACKVQS_14455 [Fimbriimonadaceae bacterium]